MENNALVLAADITAAYVSNNELQPHMIPDLIRQIYTVLKDLETA